MHQPRLPRTYRCRAIASRNTTERLDLPARDARSGRRAARGTPLPLLRLVSMKTARAGVGGPAPAHWPLRRPSQVVLGIAFRHPRKGSRMTVRRLALLSALALAALTSTAQAAPPTGQGCCTHPTAPTRVTLPAIGWRNGGRTPSRPP